MRRLLALLLLLIAAPAAADYASGLRAWARGDFVTATREFQPSAQAGDAESQYMLGRLHALNDDFVRAWVWHDRAARQGHTMAAEARDALDHVLNAQQLAQAHALAAPVIAQVPAPMQTYPPVAGRRLVLQPRQGQVAQVPRPDLQQAELPTR